jgi:hypothetical protein
MSLRILFMLGLCALGPVPVWATRQTEIDVVVDMTPQGLAHGEQPPPASDVAHLVAVALGNQGYLVAADPKLRFNARNEVVYADGTVVTVPASPPLNRPIVLNGPRDDSLTRSMIESSAGPYSIHIPSEIGPHGMPSPLMQVMTATDPIHGSVMDPTPSIIITIQWGDMHAGRITVPGDGINGSSGRTVEFDLGKLAGLVAGATFDEISMGDQQELIQRMRVDRYFVVIGAYDFKSCLGGHKGILLWSAKMSVPSNFDANFDRLLPILIRAGETHFGRESKRAEFTPVELTKEGRVIIGTPEVKDYPEAVPKQPENNRP